MKVLLFRQTKICNNLFNALTDYIAEELCKRNIEYSFIDVTQPAQAIVCDMYNTLDESFDAVLAFNDPNCHSVTMPDGESIYDKYNIQFFNWIVDHPISQLHYLDTNFRNYNVICLDRKHVEFIKRCYTNIKSVSFLPLGGISSLTEELIPLRYRKYGIVFSGGFDNYTLQEAFDSFESMENPNKDIIMNLIDYLMNNRSTEVTEALDIVLKECFGIDKLDDNNYRIALQLANLANNFMRSYNREAVLRCLVDSDLELHLFGNGWENRIGRGKHTFFLKSVSFDETESIFGSGKIVLNVMPSFKDGTHDRIASGMLHNALVMTDHSKYLDELPNGLMSFYDLDNIGELPERINDLLTDIDTAQSIADCGYEYAKNHFTWEKTVDALLEIIRLNTGLE